MNEVELLRRCQDAITADPQDCGIVLVIPRKSTGKRVKLAPRKGAPYGEIVQWYESSVVAIFDAREIVVWMVKEIATMERGEG